MPILDSEEELPLEFRGRLRFGKTRDIALQIANFSAYGGDVNEKTFKRRTKQLALDIINLVGSLPGSRASAVIGRQLLRSGTSVGANYRAACRGRSKADVASKLAIVEEEADETSYWIELLIEARIVPLSRVNGLLNEANEIIAMTVASIRTLRGRT
ncbi:MAG TPA: four helix bundle protein [Candidatus Binatia bacterium]